MLGRQKETTVLDEDALPATLDDLAVALQQLRSEAGHPSYAEIALRIARQRQARGVPGEEARPGRTTVYDAFRTGRRRVDAELVVEIVRALGVDDAEAARWALACRRARQVSEGSAPTEAPVAVAVDPGPPWKPGMLLVLGFGAACIALNLLGRLLVVGLKLEIHLDMVGTAIAAVVLGPWTGAAVGLLTNLLGTVISGWTSVPFALVNVVGGLLWGFGVHRWGFGRSTPRFFVLCVVVGTVCTTVAVPIVILLFHDITGHAEDGVAGKLGELGLSPVLAVLLANLLLSLIDKVISGFVALTCVEALPERWRRSVPLGRGVPEAHGEGELARG